MLDFWDVYAAIGTEREAEATRFAWPLIGVDGRRDLGLHSVPRP